MKVVIVEDEPLVMRRIVRFVNDIMADILTKLLQFQSLDDAEEYLAQSEVDLLLLDLNLQGQNGFELLKTQMAKGFHTIIISAYAEKAIEAFEYGVLDFIAKPCSKERLETALVKIVDNTQRSHYGCRFLSVKRANEIDLIPVTDITHIQADGHYTQLYLKSEGTNPQLTRLHSKSIEKIAALLPQQFERVHRSYIVNMNYVSALVIEPGSRYFARLHNDLMVPIGRSKFTRIKGVLEGNP